MPKRRRVRSSEEQHAAQSDCQDWERLEEYVRAYLISIEAQIQDTAQQALARASADHMLQILSTQDALRDDLRREKERRIASMQRLQAENLTLQAACQSVNEVVATLKTTEATMKSERAVLEGEKLALQQQKLDLQTEVNRLADDRDAWGIRCNTACTDLAEALRMVDVCSRAELRAKRQGAEELPPLYSAIQHRDSGPVHTIPSFWKLHEEGMKRLLLLERQSPPGGEHFALAAFRYLTDECAFLKMNFVAYGSQQDAAIAILTLCSMTVNYPLFETAVEWTETARVVLESCWTRIDDLLLVTMDHKIQSIGRPEYEPCTDCASSTCPAVQVKVERACMQLRMVALDTCHFHLGFLRYQGNWKSKVPDDISMMFLTNSRNWLMEMLEVERRALANIADARCPAEGMAPDRTVVKLELHSP